MTERDLCPVCRHANPPRNLFCGSCGALQTSNEQFATRQEYRPVPAKRALPAKVGPAGKKALAVGVVVLAAEVGVSWLRRKIGTADRSSMPAVRGAESVSRGYTLGQSLEEVLVQGWEEDFHGRVFARREVRSVTMWPIHGRR